MDPRWSAAPVHDDRPALPVVHDAVMVPAEQSQVLQARRSALCPVLYVMRVTPGWRPVAAGEDAVLVAELEGSPDRGRHDPGSSADVEWPRLRAEHRRHEAGVAGQPANRRR